MHKQFQIYPVLFITILFLSACTLIKPTPALVPTENTMAETTPEPQAEEPALTGVTWQWVSLTDPVAETQIPMPESYTLTFQEDGTVNIKADCNNAGGSYTVDDGTLTIVIGPMTMAACPPDSLSDQFVTDLGFAATYFFEDGQLLIDMMADGGTMAFYAVPQEAESTESGNMANVIEATFVCPDGTSIDAIFDNGADTVTITLPDQTLTLPRAISGSGARYSDETTIFWNKGNEALVEINGETVYGGCVAEADASTSEDAEGSDIAGSSDIVNLTWQLVEIQYMDDSIVTPTEPAQYTLTLSPDGSFAAQVDCNRGSGNYEVASSSLSFGAMATTRAMCPPDSLADQYQQGLTDANSYVLEAGDLYIAFGPDAGILHFTPAMAN